MEVRAFIASISARKMNSSQQLIDSCQVIGPITKDQFAAKVKAKLCQKYPQSEGWHKHEVNVREFTDEFYNAVEKYC